MRIIEINDGSELGAIDADRLTGVSYDGATRIACYFDREAKELFSTYQSPAAARLAYDALLSQWRGPQPQPVEPPQDTIGSIIGTAIEKALAGVPKVDPWSTPLMRHLDPKPYQTPPTPCCPTYAPEPYPEGTRCGHRIGHDGPHGAWWQPEAELEPKEPEPLFVGEVPMPPRKLHTAAEMLWMVSGGDWTKQSKEWQEMAARWRDFYFDTVHQEGRYGVPISEQPSPVRPFSVFPQKPAAVPPKKPSLADKLWEKSTDQVRKATTLAEAIRMEQPLDAAQEVPPEAVAAARKLQPLDAAQESSLRAAAEMLWVVLANVSGGDWMKQPLEWREAAERWRDFYFQAVGKTPLTEQSPLPPIGHPERVAKGSLVEYGGTDLNNLPPYATAITLHGKPYFRAADGGWQLGTPEREYGKPPVELSEEEIDKIMEGWRNSTGTGTYGMVRFIVSQARAKGAL